MQIFSLRDTDAFEDFWQENADALDMDKETAFALARNCELLVGGGAAPLFRVGFVDEEPEERDETAARWDHARDHRKHAW